MGIITRLVELNHQKKLDDIKEELDRYSKILTIEAAKPGFFKEETINWALDNIANIGEGKKSGSKAGGSGGGKDSPFKVILKGMMGGLGQLNPSPGAPKPIGQKPDVLERSPEEREQYTQHLQEQKAAGEGQIEGAREEAKNKADLKFNEQQFEQESAQRKQRLDQSLKAIDEGPFTPDQKQTMIKDAWAAFSQLGKAPMKPSSAAEKRAQLVQDWKELGKTPEEAEQLVAQGETKPKETPVPAALKTREDAQEIVDHPDQHSESDVKAAKALLDDLQTKADATKFRLGKQKADAATANTPSRNNPAGIRSAALFELMTGDKPSFGLGRSADRDEYNRVRNGLLEELGPEKVSQMKASYRAGSAELSQLLKQTGTLDAFETAFQYDIGNALEASKNVPRGSARKFNTWSQFIKADFTDNPPLAAFRVAAQTAVNQYTRLMVSAGRGTVTSDNARDHAESLLNTAMASGAFESALNQMNLEAGNMTKGLEEATGRAEQRISGPAALPKPTIPGQRLSVDQAKRYRDANGGDKEKARKAAKADGWTF